MCHTFNSVPLLAARHHNSRGGAYQDFIEAYVFYWVVPVYFERCYVDKVNYYN